MVLDNFEDMLNETEAADSGVSPGKKVMATVVSIGREYVFLDLGTRAEGMMLREDLEVDGKMSVEEGSQIEVITTSVRDGAMMCVSRLGQSAVERTDDKAQLLSQIRDACEAGLGVDGKVTGTNKGGLDIDLLGVRAFCPVSQIEIGYCEDPQSHVGKGYTFQISRFEEDGRNIIVSRKALLKKAEDEARDVAWQTLKEGDVVDGEVTSLQPYGAFVKISGVEGLLHVSEISHSRLAHPDKVLSVGQRIQVQIKERNDETGRLSLSLKSLEDDPWDVFVNTASQGSMYEGKVSRVANFGAFVEIVPGIEGLVHVSKMNTGGHVANPRLVVSPGDTVEVVVQDIDPDTRRVGLAMVDREAMEEEAAESEYRNQTMKTGGSGAMGTFADLLSGKTDK